MPIGQDVIDHGMVWVSYVYPSNIYPSDSMDSMPVFIDSLWFDYTYQLDTIKIISGLQNSGVPPNPGERTFFTLIHNY